MDIAALVILLPFLIILVIRQLRRKAIERAYTFNPPNAHGGARYATKRDLKKAGLLRRSGIRIGYSPDGLRALYYRGKGHILTVAAARTGKGATLLVNALLSWRHSCIVIDPKGENAAITGHGRKRFGKVVVLNPFGMLPDAMKGLTQARFNPMDILDVTSTAFHALCDKIAAALVWEEGKDGIHFTSAARMLISGVIAALKRHGLLAEQNLAMVARIISGDILGFCRRTVRRTQDPYIIDKLSRFADADPDNREMQDVIATARTQLGFILNAAIAYCLSGSDFRFSDLKRMLCTVYICLPLNMLDVCDKFERLVSDIFLADLLSEGQKGPGIPVLAIIDEMAQLGPHMKSLENAMGMAAGAAGLQLWCVLQDLSQLKGMFPQTWETFIQNCGVTMWFGARDHTTRSYVSQLSGMTEVVGRSRSVSFDRHGNPQVSDCMNQVGRPLLLPHEVGQLESNEMIAFVEGVSCGPIRARRKFYWKAFWRGYRRNPYVKSNGFLRWLLG